VSVDAFLSTVLAEVRALRTESAEIKAQLEQIRAALPAKLATVEEAAELTGLCATTIQRLCRAGKMPATRRGRRWLIDVSKIKPLDPREIAEAAADARGLRVVSR
jgi:excisionase family DNA binding protein